MFQSILLEKKIFIFFLCFYIVRKFPPKERTTLSLPEKIHIIEEFEMADEGLSQRKLADKYKISKTAVGDMLKNRQLLKEQFEFNSNTKRKRFKTNSKFAQVNELVWQWYKVSRENGVQMSGPMIQEKALQVAQNLQAKNFKGSNGWLHSWKSRYNVTSFKDDTGLSPKLNYINDYSKVEGHNPSLQTSDAANIIMNLDTIRKRNLLNVNAANMQGSVANLSSVECSNSSQMGNNDRDNSKCEDKSGVSSETANISEILNNARTVSSVTLKASLDTSVKTEQDPSDTGEDNHLAKTYNKVVENALSEYEDIS
jgi:kinesin family protein 6/9